MLNDKKITIADLYPELSPEEQAEAEYNLKQYVRAVKAIYDRLVEENGGKPPAWLVRRARATKRREALEDEKRTAERIKKRMNNQKSSH